MKVLVISDIHGNQVALEKVLETAQGKYSAVWCLGDLVGYGPNPNECVRIVRNLPGLVCLCGNHDLAALGTLDVSDFNPDALRAVLWGANELTEESRSYLNSLHPLDSVSLPSWAEKITLVHGSPRDPVWEYVLNPEDALDNFLCFQGSICLLGHSHIPLVSHLSDTNCSMELGLAKTKLTLNNGRYILNPGSVGQPRDMDPRAAFALFDTETLEWEFCRVEYDVEETQRRMIAHQLPQRLINRLASGR